MPRILSLPLRNVLWRAATALARKSLAAALRHQFDSHGKGFTFDPFGHYSFHHITVGDHTSLGRRPVIMAEVAWVRIGSHVMFGPAVTIVAGNHNTSAIGFFMADVHEKRPEDDLDVVIEDDVWVGARVTILNGVRVGRGSIVAAGAVVTRSCPPYSVLAGVPARVVRQRWTLEEAVRHEAALYPPNDRLPLSSLSHLEPEPVSA